MKMPCMSTVIEHHNHRIYNSFLYERRSQIPSSNFMHMKTVSSERKCIGKTCKYKTILGELSGEDMEKESKKSTCGEKSDSSETSLHSRSCCMDDFQMEEDEFDKSDFANLVNETCDEYVKVEDSLCDEEVSDCDEEDYVEVDCLDEAMSDEEDVHDSPEEEKANSGISPMEEGAIEDGNRVDKEQLLNDREVKCETTEESVVFSASERKENEYHRTEQFQTRVMGNYFKVEQSVKKNELHELKFTNRVDEIYGKNVDKSLSQISKNNQNLISSGDGEYLKEYGVIERSSNANRDEKRTRESIYSLSERSEVLSFAAILRIANSKHNPSESKEKDGILEQMVKSPKKFDTIMMITDEETCERDDCSVENCVNHGEKQVKSEFHKDTAKFEVGKDECCKETLAETNAECGQYGPSPNKVLSERSSQKHALKRKLSPNEIESGDVKNCFAVTEDVDSHTIKEVKYILQGLSTVVQLKLDQMAQSKNEACINSLLGEQEREEDIAFCKEFLKDVELDIFPKQFHFILEDDEGERNVKRQKVETAEDSTSESTSFVLSEEAEVLVRKLENEVLENPVEQLLSEHSRDSSNPNSRSPCHAKASSTAEDSDSIAEPKDESDALAQDTETCGGEVNAVFIQIVDKVSCISSTSCSSLFLPSHLMPLTNENSSDSDKSFCSKLNIVENVENIIQSLSSKPDNNDVTDIEITSVIHSAKLECIEPVKSASAEFNAQDLLQENDVTMESTYTEMESEAADVLETDSLSSKDESLSAIVENNTRAFSEEETSSSSEAKVRLEQDFCDRRSQQNENESNNGDRSPEEALANGICSEVGSEDSEDDDDEDYFEDADDNDDDTQFIIIRAEDVDNFVLSKVYCHFTTQYSLSIQILQERLKGLKKNLIEQVTYNSITQRKVRQFAASQNLLFCQYNYTPKVLKRTVGVNVRIIQQADSKPKIDPGLPDGTSLQNRIMGSLLSKPCMHTKSSSSSSSTLSVSSASNIPQLSTITQSSVTQSTQLIITPVNLNKPQLSVGHSGASTSSCQLVPSKTTSVATVAKSAVSTSTVHQLVDLTDDNVSPSQQTSTSVTTTAEPMNSTTSQVVSGNTEPATSVSVAGLSTAQTSTKTTEKKSDQHPAALPFRPMYPYIPSSKAVPPSPSIKLKRSAKDITLSWDMDMTSMHADVSSYQLFAYQADDGPVSSNAWKNVHEVKALPLPMSCNLTSSFKGHKYYFIVRAKDVSERFGPFSEPILVVFPSRNHTAASVQPSLRH